MQLNVGIIAATIPTLRPLLKKSGLTTSGNAYNQFDGQDRPYNATIGSGMKTPKSRRTTLPAGADELGYEMAKDPRTTPHQGRTTQIYSGHDDRSGSEETILDRNRGGSKGIKCTTEVVVGHAC